MGLQEEIASLAYELYESSGCAKGRDIENWLEAEKIILARHRLEDENADNGSKKQVMRSKGKKGKKDQSQIA